LKDSQFGRLVTSPRSGGEHCRGKKKKFGKNKRELRRRDEVPSLKKESILQSTTNG